MTTEKYTLEDILAISPVIPVLSISAANQAVPLARAPIKGGLRVIEITLRTTCALDAIKRISENVEDAIVGAGTVFTAQAQHLLYSKLRNALWLLQKPKTRLSYAFLYS
ncbi:MAG: hypothetical protein OQK50_05985 [Deltaproteobacteria bacterium]|jgi:2-dehydro-3-deoxyphosphogluconate aldolase/(4S)-4-hydroxy-2-oxoglutarate aldolase|nr:hypothetical protein [Deltaproteobacteria bacterium]MCW9049864.1 hypothetical protein [Deltaproteobacteria bacterium]